MYYASSMGYVKVAKKLKEKGVRVNSRVSHTGCTPLMMACRGGHKS
jgi:ankyrin repeat protein